MIIADLVTPGQVALNMRGATKPEVIAHLLDQLVDQGVLDTGSALEVQEAVLMREQQCSTGIGNGIAIPHGRCAGLDRVVVAVGVSRDGVEFESLDGKAVHVLALIVGPTVLSGLHIKVLGRISRLLRVEGLTDRLLTAQTPEDVCAALYQAESGLNGK